MRSTDSRPGRRGHRPALAPPAFIGAISTDDRSVRRDRRDGGDQTQAYSDGLPGSNNGFSSAVNVATFSREKFINAGPQTFDRVHTSMIRNRASPARNENGHSRKRSAGSCIHKTTRQSPAMLLRFCAGSDRGSCIRNTTRQSPAPGLAFSHWSWHKVSACGAAIRSDSGAGDTADWTRPIVLAFGVSPAN